jgi:hypothetical protein
LIVALVFFLRWLDKLPGYSPKSEPRESPEMRAWREFESGYGLAMQVAQDYEEAEKKKK